MKRSTASWTTAIAASALLAMPVGSWAQQTSPTPSQTPSTSRPAAADNPANEHLQKAEKALNDIPAASLTGNAKTSVAELKRHITALERSASSAVKSSAPAGKTSASTELAAADRILTELLGGEGTPSATEPGAAGTSGRTAAKAAPGLDDAAKSKLEEVRRHLTAFAASMGGSTPPPPGAADPPASASAAAAAAAASPSATTPSASPASASPSTPSASSTTSPSPATTPAPSEPSPAAATPQAQAQPQPAQQEQPPAGAQSVDTDAVKRHLTAARESLSQMTQLPAAAQLTGDARTQVSQLISNFNELISTNTNWRASYGKIQANLNTLVGDQRADESPAPTPGAAGAVGTTGTTTVDPTIRAKLVEFRAHLTEFEKVAGGASASPAASPAPTDPAAAAAQPSPTSPSTPAAPPSTPATPPSEPATPPTPTTPAEPSPAPTTPAEPSPTGTSGRTPPAPAGTTGRTTPSTPPAAAAAPSADRDAMQSEAMRHIEAIEAILNGSGTAAAAGSPASRPTAASSLDREQIEQIREHLAALRRALNQSSK